MLSTDTKILINKLGFTGYETNGTDWRVVSMDPHTHRLSKRMKEELIERFEETGVEVLKVEKVRHWGSPYIRVTFIPK